MKVDQETQRDIEQPHITQKLGLVDRQYAFDRLDLNQDAALDQEIAAQGFDARELPVGYLNDSLGFAG